jgi:hypothetical protein
MPLFGSWRQVLVWCGPRRKVAKGEQWGAPYPKDPFQTILAQEDTAWYQQDLFGIRTSGEAGKNLIMSRHSMEIIYSSSTGTKLIVGQELVLCVNRFMNLSGTLLLFKSSRGCGVVAKGLQNQHHEERSKSGSMLDAM